MLPLNPKPFNAALQLNNAKQLLSHPRLQVWQIYEPTFLAKLESLFRCRDVLDVVPVL